MFRLDKRLFTNFDWVMLVAFLVVTGISIINLYSAGYKSELTGTPFYIKQMYFTLIGVACMIIIFSFDYRVLLNFGYPLYGMINLLLLLALIIGKTEKGSQRWIDLGLFNLQPSELAKLILVIVLASYYYRKDTGQGFSLQELIVPIFLCTVPFIMILIQPDLGTGLLLVFIFISMTLFVKLRWSTFLTLLGAAVAAGLVGWMHVLKPYQQQRIMTFLNPEGDPRNTGYHILQSKIAMGSGMEFGKGYLKGTQGHLDFLPERHTDFVFSVWAEEWGFVGSLFFLGCYFFLILWGVHTAVQSKDKFGVILAFGICSLLFWQAFINLAMVMGLLPVVGIPLPLMSYGGSSLITTIIGIAILMNIRMRRFLIP